MFARIFFICFGLISLFWITYVAFDIVDKENMLTPTSVFGVEDKELLIINRTNEVNRELITFVSTIQNEKIVSVLMPSIEDARSIYISSERSHFMIESSNHWTKDKVEDLLKKSKLSYSKPGKNEFVTGNYTVNYNKNFLYFHQENYSSIKTLEWKKFDRKASACLIQFKNDTVSIRDIYINGKNKVEFQSTNLNKIKGKQINDKDIFSMVLPSSIDNYHFLEKEYFSSIDNDFLNGPMFQWIDKGVVTFNYNGHKVFISDYVVGQDPINVLFDLVKKDAENVDHAYFKNIKLSNDFPKNKQLGFYIYNLNDFVVMCENQSVCEEIIKENKLGNTLATNADLMNDMFHGLPSLVSERVINSEEKFSRTIYKSKILETRLNINPKISDKIEKPTQNQSFLINIDESIFDFISFNGKGNCIVLTANGKLKNYKNGLLVWEKNIPGKVVGKIQYNSASETFLITCKQTIHLFDKKGDYISLIENKNISFSQESTLYNWKGKLFIVAPNESGELVVYDSKGKQQSKIQTNIKDISASVDVWVSQKKLFFGVRNDQIFKMYHAERNKEFRSFPLPGKSFSVIRGNELDLFSSKDGNLVVLDQKGRVQSLNHVLKSDLSSIENLDENYFLSKNDRSLSLYNADGKSISELKLDFSNIEFVDVKSINGRIYISIIDDLENNVYLHQLNGNRILKKPLEGSKKTSLNTLDNKIVLTSVVDNYIIQYMLNL